MSKSSRQKLKLLYLQKILLEQTDEDHLLSTDALLRQLEDLGVTAERKSIYDDIAALQQFGMDILLKKGRNGGYFVGSRSFELPELKLLVDIIQASKFLTPRKSDALIRKIEALGSIYQARAMQRQVLVSGRAKTENEGIYYNVDQIHAAISANLQIRFRYFEWQVDFSQGARFIRHYRRDGAFYQVSPWMLIWDNLNYYLVAYDESAGQIRHYRVDKMEQISQTEHARCGREAFAAIDRAAYGQQVFSMYSGAQEQVTLSVENRLAGVICDRFGESAVLRPLDDNHFSVHLTVSVSEQFFGWLAGLGTGVRILAPQTIAEQYRCHLQSLLTM